MKFTIRDLFFITVIVAVATAWWLDHRRLSAELAPSVAFGLTPNGTPVPTLDLEFRQGSFSSATEKAASSPQGYEHDKQTFAWQDAVGQRVTVEGIAWGSYDKGLGECVLMNDAKVFVEPGNFLHLKAYGRPVKVSGILRQETENAGSPLQAFIIESAVVQLIEKVEWPWMTRKP
ncbi:MAG: hypothetical protein ACKVP0_03795 [Pirellulaceae bacterium]